MTRVSQTIAILLVGYLAVSCSADESKFARRPNIEPPRELQKLPSQHELQNFHQQEKLQPLSFTDGPNSGNSAYRPTSTPPKELQKAASQPDLQNFFQEEKHQPLSFSYFDRPASSNSQESPRDNSPKPFSVTDLPKTVSPKNMLRTTSTNEDDSPFRMAASTNLDTVMQAIRDLKLTVAEMDEKIDRVVQKVAPEGRVSLMRQGADIMKKIFHLPPSKDPLKTNNERGYGFSDNGGLQRGVGLGRW